MCASRRLIRPSSRLAIVFLSLVFPALVAAKDVAQDPAVPTPATDPQLARNLAAMAEGPGVLDLAWREHKQAVAGVSAAPLAVSGAFPDAESITLARAYSDEHQGHGLLVWYRGELVDAHVAEGFEADTPFAAYSMHKSVLALAVLAAIEDGILPGLDTGVGSLIPEWRDDPRAAITLRQLLNQTSGLAHYPVGQGDPRGTALALSSEISATALSYPLSDPPGEVFNYNNVNAQVVGIALEHALAAEGLGYADYLSSRLWKPLGNGEAQLWLESADGSPRYYAGLEAGLADWLRIGRMLLDGGQLDGRQLLTGSSLEQLIQPSALNLSYGLSVWLGGDWHPQRRYGPSTGTTVPHAEPYLAPDVLYFDGFGGQRVYVVPSADLVVARAGEVDLAYDDSVIVNALLRGLQRAEVAAAREAYRGEEAEATYLERFERFAREAQQAGGLASYDPLVPLPGTAELIPLDRGDASWLTGETADWLSTFGAETNTQALMVWHRGRIVFEDYFGGNGYNDLVVSRSLSKPLSVIAVGRAIEEGFIDSLDVPISRYLTEWRDSDKAGITLRHLLQMRSGLLPQDWAMDPDSVLNRAYLHPYHIQVTLAEYPLVSEPGTRYDYSNVNAELIAPIIERATGRRYDHWVSAEVLAPLGASGGDTWINRPGGIPHSGCCSRLPAESYLRLALLLLNDGVREGERLLPEGYVRQMLTPTATNPHAGMGLYVAGPYVEGRGAANPDIAMGKTPHGEAYLDRDLWLFDGNANQVVYVIPRHELIILRVGDRPPKSRPWDNTELPNRLLRALHSRTGAELVPQEGPLAVPIPPD